MQLNLILKIIIFLKKFCLLLHNFFKIDSLMKELLIRNDQI